MSEADTEATGEDQARVALLIEVVHDLDRIPAAQWDALVGDDNPFVEHTFLQALEESESVGPESGWLPYHLVVRAAPDGDPERASAPLGAAPLYLKANSYGEYIFDWGWAHAAMRAGLEYYPKLTSAIPFTPATGPRLLVHPDAPRAAVQGALAGAAINVAQQIDASSVHWLFCPPDEADTLASHGYTHRLSRQFHWRNPGWRTFDEYLSAMTSKRRKEVRRERRKAASHGLDVQIIAGPDLADRHWDALYRFYSRTVSINGQIRYLKRRFYELLQARFAHRVVAVIVEDAGRPVAGAINFRKGPHLYGRYWGTLADYEALHFECCYYRLIDYAVQTGVTLFEAGAQGHHKLRRGFLPAFTHSGHAVLHGGLRRAIDRFIAEERDELRRERAWLMDRSPFRGQSPEAPEETC